MLESDAFKQQATPDARIMAATYADAFKRPARSASQDGESAVFGSFDQYWFMKALSEAIEGKVPLERGLAEAQKFTTACRPGG